MAFAAARMIRDNQNKERKASSSDLPIPARARGGSQVSKLHNILTISIFRFHNSKLIQVDFIEIQLCNLNILISRLRIDKCSFVMR